MVNHGLALAQRILALRERVVANFNAGDWKEVSLRTGFMDWNNNTLYKKLPVTLVYSQAFAKIIQQSSNMVDNVYDFHNFM